jgi:1-acyl-sn-glycerol-3-phosphate acyltransferase
MPRRLLTTLALRAGGWQFEGDVPVEKKYVLLAVPHTSNWDGLVLLLITRSIGLEMAWMIKDTWFKGPMGAALRRVGAVAIHRERSHNVVAQMIEEFHRRQRFVLVIPPEGTRGRAEHWKSGFYHIARGAGVPVVPGYVDYGRKRCGLGPPIWLSGEVGADMDRIRAFYARVAHRARRPEDAGPMRLRDESQT